MELEQILGRARAAVSMALASPFALVGLLIVAGGIRGFLATKIEAPQTLCDEFIYANQARNLFEHGQYMVRGEHTIVSAVYPLLLAPAWLARSMQTTYTIAKSINVVVMTLTALPVYFWTRRLAGPRYALVAAAVTLLLPSFHFSALLMTESAFLPAFLLSTYLIARSVEEPTQRKQVLAVLGMLLAVGVRVEGLALFPVLPTAILVVALLDTWTSPRGARWRTLRGRLVPFWPTLSLLAALAVFYLAAVLINGSRAPGFGFYEANVHKGYAIGPALRGALKNLEGLVLTIGVVPASALIVLVGLARRAGPPLRAFVVVTVATSFWLLLEVGAVKGGGIYERYTFYLGPLYIIALFAWLALGLPRPIVWTALAAAIPFLLVLKVPERTYEGTLVPNNIGFHAFFRLALKTPGGADGVHWLIGGAALLSAVVLALVFREVAALVFPAALATFLILSTVPPFGLLRNQAHGSRYAPSVAPNPSRIDDAIGSNAHATYLYTPAANAVENSLTLLETEFWNRSVTSVSNLGQHEICAIPEDDRIIESGDGRVTSPHSRQPFTSRYVIADRSVRLVGRVLAQRTTLALYETSSPIRVASQINGIYSDGWSSADVGITRFATGGPPVRAVRIALSRLSLELPDAPSPVHVRLWPSLSPSGRPLVSQKRTIHMGDAEVFVLRAPRPPFTVTLTFDTPFTPSQFGQPDPRPLGAKVYISFLSQRPRRTTTQ